MTTPSACERTAWASAGLAALRIDRDAHGRAVRVYIGPLDVTHLVARMQTNTTPEGTFEEVVLSGGRIAP